MPLGAERTSKWRPAMVSVMGSFGQRPPDPFGNRGSGAVGCPVSSNCCGCRRFKKRIWSQSACAGHPSSGRSPQEQSCLRLRGRRGGEEPPRPSAVHWVCAPPPMVDTRPPVGVEPPKRRRGAAHGAGAGAPPAMVTAHGRPRSRLPWGDAEVSVGKEPAGETEPPKGRRGTVHGVGAVPPLSE